MLYVYVYVNVNAQDLGCSHSTVCARLVLVRCVSLDAASLCLTLLCLAVCNIA